MRFDPERVLALAKTLPWPRLARSEGARRAADEMAKHFEEAGLLVEQVESPSGVEDWVVMIGVIFITFCILPIFFLTGTSVAFRVGVTVAMLLGWAVAGLLTRRRARAAGCILKPHHIIGKTRHEGRPPVSIVIVAPIQTRCDPWEQRLFLIFGILFIALIQLLIEPEVEDAIRAEPRIEVSVFLAAWLCAILMLSTFRWRPAPPGLWDGRIELAMLAELASNWPRGLGNRIEAWFVATPNVMALNALLMKSRGEFKDTLVIGLESPGYGSEVVITGHGPGAALAEKAARDLWIPHRRASWLSTTLRELLHGPALGTFPQPWFKLGGGRTNLPFEPAALAASAQLLTEVAFRWAKQPANHQEESLARSSQNPG
jgi:hypothetical protein